ANRLLRGSVVGALLILVLGTASTASAVWTTNGSAGGAAFSAAAGPPRIRVTAVGSTSVQGGTCSSSTATGTLFGPTLASGHALALFTPAFSGSCVLQFQD